jgi:hypothetical protein
MFSSCPKKFAIQMGSKPGTHIPVTREKDRPTAWSMKGGKGKRRFLR